MTVKELIEHLQTLPNQDWQVWCSYDAGLGLGSINQIERTLSNQSVYVLGGD